jgi:hypothetical protein
MELFFTLRLGLNKVNWEFGNVALNSKFKILVVFFLCGNNLNVILQTKNGQDYKTT